MQTSTLARRGNTLAIAILRSYPQQADLAAKAVLWRASNLGSAAHRHQQRTCCQSLQCSSRLVVRSGSACRWFVVPTACPLTAPTPMRIAHAHACSVCACSGVCPLNSQSLAGHLPYQWLAPMPAEPDTLFGSQGAACLPIAHFWSKITLSFDGYDACSQ